MRKYQIISKGGHEFNASHIGLNHTSNGIIIDDLSSSYDKEFDNDDEVCFYNNLGKMQYCKIGDISEAYQILKEEIRTISPRDIYDYSECVQRTIMRYFGNYSNLDNRLLNNEIKLVSDLAHKNSATSVERAMLSQNLLNEIGIKSIYKINGAIINGKEAIHAFNLVRHDGKNYVFDATFPTINNNKISPIICEIPQDVYEKISSPNSYIGYSVSVSHENPLQEGDCHITYDAGRIDIYEIEKIKVNRYQYERI